ETLVGALNRHAGDLSPVCPPGERPWPFFRPYAAIRHALPARVADARGSVEFWLGRPRVARVPGSSRGLRSIARRNHRGAPEGTRRVPLRLGANRSAHRDDLSEDRRPVRPIEVVGSESTRARCTSASTISFASSENPTV